VPGIIDEHFDYLSLDGRTELFDEAFAKVITDGDTVADLGCGFGILGILCLDAGASRVWGIEQTDAIEIARQTVERLGLADAYQCVRGKTFTTDLPDKVDAIVCDHVGYFGFDYGLIELLADARERYLKPGGAIVPRRLRLMVAGASSPAARKLADGWALPPIPPAYHWLREYGVNSRHTYIFSPDELCTEAVSLGEIDLATATAGGLSFDTELAAARDCEIDGIAGWFECELAEGVWMTNSPTATRRIDRAQVFLPVADPVSVAQGCSIRVGLRTGIDHLLMNWSVATDDPPSRQKMSTFRSRIVAPDRIGGPANDGGPVLNTAGLVEKAVLRLTDGTHSAEQIENAVAKDFAGRCASDDDLRKMVRAIIARTTSS
jgi:type I protein arginine methyltransferase